MHFIRITSSLSPSKVREPVMTCLSPVPFPSFHYSEPPLPQNPHHPSSSDSFAPINQLHFPPRASLHSAISALRSLASSPTRDLFALVREIPRSISFLRNPSFLAQPSRIPMAISPSHGTEPSLAERTFRVRTSLPGGRCAPIRCWTSSRWRWPASSSPAPSPPLPRAAPPRSSSEPRGGRPCALKGAAVSCHENVTS
jgi:hypothetical protein